MTDARITPTLEDVAKLAGVSTATVSRCLNAPQRVVEQTRDKVLQAVADLGYTPNFGARAMAAKRTFTIGAIIPTMENAIFARGLQAFQEELHARGYTLLVSSSAYQPELEAEQIRTLVARGADGLLLIGHDRDPAIYEYLTTQAVPTLVAWTYDPQAAQLCVGFDNRAAMYALTCEVLKLGHKKLGVISGHSRGNDRVRLRLEGVRQAVAEAGLDPDAVPIVETSYEIESGNAGFDALLEAGTRPTAVICGNDLLAVGALRRAQARGLDVPGDVSITGFDDMELALLVDPALTTVAVPHRDMGQKAAQVLVDMVEKKSDARSVKLPTLVKLRGSLGAV